MKIRVLIELQNKTLERIVFSGTNTIKKETDIFLLLVDSIFGHQFEMISVYQPQYLATLI